MTTIFMPNTSLWANNLPKPWHFLVLVWLYLVLDWFKWLIWRHNQIPQFEYMFLYLTCHWRPKLGQKHGFGNIFVFFRCGLVLDWFKWLIWGGNEFPNSCHFRSKAGKNHSFGYIDGLSLVWFGFTPRDMKLSTLSQLCLRDISIGHSVHGTMPGPCWAKLQLFLHSPSSRLSRALKFWRQRQQFGQRTSQ